MGFETDSGLFREAVPSLVMGYTKVRDPPHIKFAILTGRVLGLEWLTQALNRR